MSLLYSLPAVASDSTLTNVASIATVVGTGTSIFAMIYAIRAFNRQKKDSEEQKILGAWSLLAQKGTGDLGRKDALEFLHSKGKSLNGVDLSNAYLVGLKLKGADLSGCNFSGANLDGAVFVGTKLWHAHFEGANLGNANFEGANLWDAHFEGADLGDAHFKGASLLDAHFEGADLGDAHFKGAELCGAKFKGANLYKANFEGAENIDSATFENCYVIFESKDSLPTAPEGYEFVLETNEDGTEKTKVVDEMKRYYIKLIKTETKKP